MESIDDSPFDRLKARYLLPAFIGSMFVSFFIVPNQETPLITVVSNYASYLIIGWILYLFVVAYEIDINRLFLASDYSVDVRRLTLGIAFPVICISIASVWLVFYPLSFLWPNFVEIWLLDSSEEVFWSEGKFLWGINIAHFFFLCVVVPCVEEVLFRGFLLQRWSRRWGVNTAVILSSLLFGVMHVDILGGIIFGYIMCVLYIQTKSLWAPIVVHGINNAVAWVFSYVSMFDGYVDNSITAFQQNLWIGLVCFFVSTPWLINYLKTNHPRSKWVAPYDA